MSKLTLHSAIVSLGYILGACALFAVLYFLRLPPSHEAVAGGKEIPPVGAELTKAQSYGVGRNSTSIIRYEFSDGLRCVIMFSPLDSTGGIHCDWPKAK